MANAIEIQGHTTGDDSGGRRRPLGLHSLSSWDWYSLIIPMIAISPLLYIQATSLWAKQHLQFFPLACAAVVWFFYEEGIPDLPMPNARKMVAKWLAAVGILMGYASLLLFSSWLSHLALIVLVFAWSLGRFANLTVLRISGICGLLLVTLPPPFNWDQAIVSNLQSLSTIVSNRLMDITYVLHVQRGNVIDIASKSLFVEEACSGVDSQYALMAVAGTLLLVGRAGLFVSLLTIVTVPIWAILGNLLRIYSIAIGIEWLGIDLSSGIKHTALGLVTFCLAAWAHWSSVQFFNFISVRFFPIETNIGITTRPSANIGFENTSSQAIIRSLGLLFSIGMLVLTPAALMGVLVSPYSSLKVPDLSAEVMKMLPASRDLPYDLLGAKRINFQTQTRERDELDGKHSRIWSYSRDNVNQVFSLDLPFRGWHPLWLCYELTGWTLESAESVDVGSGGRPLAEPFFESKLRNPNGDHAILHFSLLTENGEPYFFDLRKEQTKSVNRFERSLIPVVKEFMNQLSKPNEPLTFQFQLLSTTQEPPTQEEILGFRESFLSFREIIARKSLPALQKLVDKDATAK